MPPAALFMLLVNPLPFWLLVLRVGRCFRLAAPVQFRVRFKGGRGQLYAAWSRTLALVPTAAWLSQPRGRGPSRVQTAPPAGFSLARLVRLPAEFRFAESQRYGVRALRRSQRWPKVVRFIAPRKACTR